MNSLISVIIPAYNHEKYMQDAIKSVIAQTYQNIELIIIDDGSKDSTWQKIQEMKSECEKRFSRVHFETKQNEGTCKTLNKLLSLTQGEFVYLIASDDMAKSHAIEKEIIFLKNNPDYVLAVGDNEFINADNQRIGWDTYRNPTEIHQAEFKTFVDFLDRKLNIFHKNPELVGNYNILLKHGNHIPNGYLIRKSALADIVFTPEAPLEDFYLMLQLAKRGRIKYIDEILYSYRWHTGNTASQIEHMQKMTIKTYQYEKHLLEQTKNDDLLNIFNEMTEYYKTRFRIGNFIKFYKHKTLTYKEDILEIFGKKFQTKYKKFIE